MKTFPLRLPDDLHKEIQDKSHDARKSMHQFILDCIKYPPIQLGNIEDELKKEGFVGRHFPKEQPTPSKEKEPKLEPCVDYDDLPTGTVINNNLLKKSPAKKEYGYPKSRSLGKKK